MKQFDVLYKRAKSGAIQFWQVSVVGSIQEPVVHKKSGKIGTTNPLIHTEAITKGKQKRTPHEQAMAEAESDWKRKRDEGYKSRQDLKIDISGDLMHYSIDHVKYKTLTEALNAVLPEFNTDASGNIKPQLAPTKPWKHGDKKNKYPMYSETKFDGVRSLAIVEKTDTNFEVTFLSRSGKIYDTLGHIRLELVRLQQHFRTGTTILDGEVYKHGWALSEINRAVKKYREDVTEQLEFWVYDVPLHTGIQKERMFAIADLFYGAKRDKIQISVSRDVLNDDQVQQFHDVAVAEGFEGLILKDPNGTYQQGQRSNFWTKVKMFDETEFKIIGYKIGQRPEDLVFECECDGTQTKTFEVKMKGSREMKAELVKDMDNIIGKDLTVKHFGYTEYNVPFIPTGKAIRDYE